MKTHLLSTVLAFAALASGCDNSVTEDKLSAVDTGTSVFADTGAAPEVDTADTDAPADTGGSDDPVETHDTGTPSDEDTGQGDIDDGEQETPPPADRDSDGFTEAEGDCDDLDDRINPAVIESCDGIDNDCDGVVDEASAYDASVWYLDTDGDGFGDATAAIWGCIAPTGYVADATDCDDASADTYPGAPEYCDSLDNDCDGTIDMGIVEDPTRWYADADGDGFGDASVRVKSCEAPSGYVSDSSDCADTDSDVFPGAAEYCDGIDNDCDAMVDEASDSIDVGTWYPDADGDGYGQTGPGVKGCTAPVGYIENDEDCDDDDAAAHPSAEEFCDGIDSNCDGIADAGIATWFPEAGAVEDYTSALTGDADALAVVRLEDSGALKVCEGTWYVHISLQGPDMVLEGIGDPARTVLSGGVTDGASWTGGHSVPVTAAASVRSTVRNLTIAEGWAYSNGGGMEAYTPILEMDSVIVRDCWSEGNGAGVGTYDSDVLVTNSQFIRNTSNGYHGGGMAVLRGSLTMVDSVFTDNASDVAGGGLYVEASADITDSEFVGNSAIVGGGLYVRGEATLDGTVTMTENSASKGGAIFVTAGDLVASGLVASRNTAESDGGAICVYGGVDLVDVSLVDNTAGGNGGALHLQGETAVYLTLEDTIIEGNAAEGEGGGVSMLATDGGVSMNCEAAATSTGGFRSNEAAGAFGAGAVYMDGEAARLSSSGCDWGRSTSDNLDVDIVISGYWADVDADDADLYCEIGACTGADDQGPF